MDTVRVARRERFYALLDTWPEEDVRTLATMLARFNGLVQENGTPARSRPAGGEERPGSAAHPGAVNGTHS
jgi:hypothetical protein